MNELPKGGDRAFSKGIAIGVLYKENRPICQLLDGLVHEHEETARKALKHSGEVAASHDVECATIRVSEYDPPRLQQYQREPPLLS